MLWILRQIQRPSHAFQKAVKDGRLVNMQRWPFTKVTKKIPILRPVAMTPAAYREFILVPSEKMVLNLRYARWRAVLFRFSACALQQEKIGGMGEGSKEIVYEVTPLRLSGFRQTLQIKARMEQGDEINSALIFMLPDEKYPLPA